MAMMKERERILWRVVLQLLPAFVTAALAVIVGAFSDVFPSWAFLTLIIIISLFLVIALMRLVLGDLLAQL